MNFATRPRWLEKISVASHNACETKSRYPIHLGIGFFEKLAATYSRGVYKTTTIGKAAFDGRVRDGNGSDHSFMATKKRL